MTPPALKLTEVGQGEPIVVLGATWSPMAYVMPLARALAKEWRVLVASYPGYDGNPARAGAFSWDADRALLEDALRAHGVGDLAAVVGSSLGGYRALALACAGAVRVRAVVELGGFAELSDAEREGMRGFAGAIRARAVPPHALSQVALSPAFAAAHPEAVREVDEWPQTLELDAVAAEYDGLAECPSLLGKLASLNVPLLARAGDADVAVPRAHSDAMASAAPRAELEIVHGAGHMLLLEDGDATIASVTRFLERARAQVAP